jgi:hypothetical protein
VVFAPPSVVVTSVSALSFTGMPVLSPCDCAPRLGREPFVHGQKFGFLHFVITTRAEIPEIGSERKSVNLMQEVSNAKSTTEVIDCDHPPKSIWLFGAVDHTTIAPQRFSGTRRRYSQGS